ncbi:MAG: phosphatase PAP2 family protein [bacterium]|nr:phosphatase PAP2 family protein [bacterium]
MPIYFLAFGLIEKNIQSDYWVSYCIIDDYIPFVKEFVVAYVSWYPLLLGVAVWTFLKDKQAFKRYAWSIIIGLSLSVIICIILPNGQDLRPEIITTDIFSKSINYLYLIDTNTNVFPSMHVVATIAALFAVFDTKTIKGVVTKSALVILGILICLSTVFIKQHSILDIFSGLVIGIIIYVIVYVLIKRHMKNNTVEGADDQ